MARPDSPRLVFLWREGQREIEEERIRGRRPTCRGPAAPEKEGTSSDPDGRVLKFRNVRKPRSGVITTSWREGSACSSSTLRLFNKV